MPADERRVKIRPLTVVLIVVALACFAVAVYYAVTPADQLAGIFPGHDAGSTHHHTKHALGAAAVGLAVLVGAWFTTAPSRSKDQAGSRSPQESDSTEA
jgi:hypothetical protein